MIFVIDFAFHFCLLPNSKIENYVFSFFLLSFYTWFENFPQNFSALAFSRNGHEKNTQIELNFQKKIKILENAIKCLKKDILLHILLVWLNYQFLTFWIFRLNVLSRNSKVNLSKNLLRFIIFPFLELNNAIKEVIKDCKKSFTTLLIEKLKQTQATINYSKNT